LKEEGNDVFDTERTKTKEISVKPWFCHSKKVIAALMLILLFITGGTVYAFSPTMQNVLANKLHLKNVLANRLHLKEEDTSIIDKSVSDSGITMSVVSSHVAGSTAVVMLAFTKDNEETFGNSLNPDIENLSYENKKIENYMVDGKLSEDKNTLYCYFTWNANESLDGKTVTLTVNHLICNESQVEGITFSDELISGSWSLKFTLDANTDNTVTGINTDLSKTVSMCGKELQIDSVVVADLQVIVHTTTLKDAGLPVDMLSNVSTSSGMYYDVSVWVVYEDDSQSEKNECMLDENNNIIAYSFNSLMSKEIKEVHVKDVVIAVE